MLFSSIFISLSPPTKRDTVLVSLFVGYESSFELLLVAMPRIEFASATKGVVSSLAKAPSQLIFKGNVSLITKFVY